MALKNFTEGENQKTVVVLSCSEEFTAEVQGELIFLCNCKHPSVDYSSSGKLSDPSSFTQRNFTSPAVQTSVS